jgi:hypothetical protein
MHVTQPTSASGARTGEDQEHSATRFAAARVAAGSSDATSDRKTGSAANGLAIAMRAIVA